MQPPFVEVAKAHEVERGKFIRVQVAERPYIIAHVGERFYAVEDNCSHEDYPLSYGCLDGARIKCSLHGSRFSLETGQPANEPADEPIRTYRVELADGVLWLDPSAPLNGV